MKKWYYVIYPYDEPSLYWEDPTTDKHHMLKHWSTPNDMDGRNWIEVWSHLGEIFIPLNNNPLVCSLLGVDFASLH